MRITKYSITTEYGLMDLFLLIYLSELVFPILGRFGNPTAVRLICLVGWMFCSVLADRRFYTKISLPVLLALMYYIITIVYSYIFGDAIIAHRYMSLALIPLGFVIFSFYYKHDDLERLKVITLITMILAGITAIVTYLNLLIDPYIVRSIKSSGDYSEALAARGIGSYAFIYFIVAASVVVLFIFLQERRILYKICVGLLYFFSVLLIVRSNYLTAFFAAIFSAIVLIVLYAFQNDNNVVKTIVRVIIILTVTIFFLMFFDKALYAIRDIVPKRIAQVIYSRNGSIFDAALFDFRYDRFPVMKQSIDSFLANPLFGLVFKQDFTTDEATLQALGQHSYLLDTFALFGIGIGVLSIIVICLPFLRMNVWSRKFYSLNIALFICIIILYLFNNATDTIAYVATIIYPLVALYVNSNRNESKA